jgi:hypothetical protein
MCGSRAALFLLQKGGFSCRDAHAFNRYSYSQVTPCVGSMNFPLVTRGFSIAFSPAFLSSLGSPCLVMFPFVTDKFPGAFSKIGSAGQMKCT